jgi:hypothetical protein
MAIYRFSRHRPNRLFIQRRNGMSEELYKIVYRGEIGFGWSREEVAANLKERFKFTDGALAKLFSGRVVTLKKDLPEAAARRMADALGEAGAPCAVLPMVEKPAVRKLPSPELAQEAAPKENIETEEEPPFMTCPQCGKQQPQAENCNACGVTVANYRERQQGRVTGVVGEDFGAEQPAEVATANIVAAMAGTRPWVRLISVLMFIAAALMVLVTAASLLAGGVSGAPVALIAPFQIANIVLYLFPAYFLYKYSGSIGVFLRDGGTGELEAALGYQKSFWKFIGILTLVMLVISVVGIVAAIAIPGLVAGL